MRIAITRRVSPQFSQCTLTHLPRVPIDFACAEQQHLAYEKALTALGCAVESLPAEPELPDSVFVEDVALVFDELAIIARPGAESRRAEVAPVAAALKRHRKLHFIEAPATLDGGDVLCVDRRVFVGLSQRTNAAALDQMCAALAPLHYAVESVRVEKCLHLKSAVTQVAERTLLLNPSWVDMAQFRGMDCIEVAPKEPFAANALRIGETVVYSSAYPETRRRMEERGISLGLVEVTEFAKAEGGVTCCSLVFRAG